LPGQAQRPGEIANDEDAEDVEGHAFNITRAQSEQSVLSMRSPQLEKRHMDELVCFLDACERRRLHDLQADIEADRDQHRTDEEGYAPTPRKEVGLRKIG